MEQDRKEYNKGLNKANRHIKETHMGRLMADLHHEKADKAMFLSTKAKPYSYHQGEAMAYGTYHHTGELRSPLPMIKGCHCFKKKGR